MKTRQEFQLEIEDELAAIEQEITRFGASDARKNEREPITTGRRPKRPGR
jgi:hypothetical protein